MNGPTPHTPMKIFVDWCVALAPSALGLLLLPENTWLITKEVLVVVSLVVGIATNAYRLYKDSRKKKEEKED